VWAYWVIFLFGSTAITFDVNKMSSHKGSSREAFTVMSFGSTGCSEIDKT
jgi:hypothetical protein